MSAAADTIRIVLVDDHMLLREGLREILGAEADLEVVAEAGDSAGAVAAVGRERPDIVLLDVEIPGDEVTTTVRKMQAVSPSSRVIILSMYDGPQLVQGLLGLGVKGYLLKSVTRLELVAAIRSANADEGRIVLSVSPESFLHAEIGSSVLSARECAVLQLVADAMSNVQIASRLGLTEATVKRHLRNIFVKLGAVSRIDAVNKAVAASLIQRSQSADEAGGASMRVAFRLRADGARRPAATDQPTPVAPHRPHPGDGVG
jgi:DNA-binding NarL/FixJ family response regulator